MFFLICLGKPAFKECKTAEDKVTLPPPGANNGNETSGNGNAINITNEHLNFTSYFNYDRANHW